MPQQFGDVLAGDKLAQNGTQVLVFVQKAAIGKTGDNNYIFTQIKGCTKSLQQYRAIDRHSKNVIMLF
jgi:hypothetical protein